VLNCSLAVRVAIVALLAMAGTQPLAATPHRQQFAAAIAAAHHDNLKILQDWVSYPTIAAEGMNAGIDAGAGYMRRLLLDAGFQQAKVVPTAGVAGVFATLEAGARDCVGVYFMYDVKQFEAAQWSSPPLEATLVDRQGVGKVLIGRGVSNQKGPETVFLAALQAFKTTGRKLPLNIVLVAEGEEEIGSPHFHAVIETPEVRSRMQKCIGVFMPYIGQSTTGASAIALGAKGMVELQLISSGEHWGRGPDRDIHSMQMARVESPAWHLIQALNTLVKADGHTPAIEGWFDNVQPLTQHQKDLVAANASKESEAEEMQRLGVKHWIDDEDYLTSSLRLASQPTINIQGLVSGYAGPGGKTILPDRAEAKLDFRLVPDMTRDEAIAKLRKHLQDHGFGDIEVNVSGGYGPTETDDNSALIRAQIAALNHAGIDYSLNPRLAGSWPGVVFTGPPLHLPTDMFGLGRGGNAHAPDEWFLIESSNPKVAGFDATAMFFVDFLYQAAETARTATNQRAVNPGTPPSRAAALLGRAQQLLDGKRAGEAYALLYRQYDQRARQPDYDLLMGIAALDSGRLFEAVFALERVSAVQPDNIRARAELGRALYNMGERAAARREFTALKKQSIPESMAHSIDQYLSEIEAHRTATQSRRVYQGAGELRLPWQFASAAATTGRVVFASGNPVATDRAGVQRSLRRGDDIFVGDDLTTAVNGILQISFADGGFITLQPASEYRIDEYHWSGKSDGTEGAVYRLAKGCIRGVTGLIGEGRPNAYKIATAYANVGVRGVGFNTRICAGDCATYADGFYYKTWEGTTYVRTNVQEIEVPDGTDFYVKDINSAIKVLSESPGHGRGTTATHLNQ